MPAAIELQRRALAVRNDVLCFSQIHVYRWDIWLSSLQPEDLEIVTGLLTYPQPAVSTAAIGILPVIGQVQPEFAVQAALSADIGEDINRAQELCGVFDKQHGVGVSLLSSEQRAIVLEKLVPIKDIGGYHIGMFLEGLSRLDADLVFHFFQRRIRYLIEHPESEYQAIPFEHRIPELVGLARHPGYGNLLREVRDYSLEVNGLAAHIYPDLFRIVSLNYSDVALEVLQEWFDSEEEQKVVAAAHLLREAPRGFLFSHLDYFDRVLEQSYVLGDECYTQVAHYVSYCEVFGSRHGTPGQPFPEDVQLRERALEAAKRLSVFDNLIVDHLPRR